MSNHALSTSKPKPIQQAVICLWVSAGLVALLTVVSWTGALGIPSGVEPMVTNLISFLLLALVAMKVSAGRNWARWLFAVIYTLGSLMLLVSLLLAPQVFSSFPMVLLGSTIAQFALQTVALVLLFIGTSSQWFKSRGAAT